MHEKCFIQGGKKENRRVTEWKISMDNMINMREIFSNLNCNYSNYLLRSIYVSIETDLFTGNK